MHQLAPWLDRHDLSLSTVVATFALIVAVVVAVFVHNLLLKYWLQPFGKKIGVSADLILSFARIVTVSIWLIALLLALDLWGVSVGGFWTLLASGAAVIGVGFLATWAMISNVTASLFLAVWRPFHLGDTVALLPENFKGRAVDRNLMFTVLREEDGSVLQVPNNLFFQKIFRVGG